MVRFVIIVLVAAALGCATTSGQPQAPADLIVRNARFTTLDNAKPEAQAFAVRGRKLIVVGFEDEVMPHRGDQTRVIDAGGRRVIEG